MSYIVPEIEMSRLYFKWFLCLIQIILDVLADLVKDGVDTTHQCPATFSNKEYIIY
jgi:hypothetical protein